MLETHIRNIGFLEPPEPSRSSSRCSGSTVLAYPSGPLKVIKNIEKKNLHFGTLGGIEATKKAIREASKNKP